MARVIIAGGGTGGHVFPALAVASELVKKGVEVLFVGTRRGLESQMVPKKGWEIEYLGAPRWKGEGLFARLKALVYLPLAVAAAFRILMRFKASAVIGVGGYASLPIGVASIIKGVPLLLMEQNSIPGSANKLLARFARRVCTSFPVTERYLGRARVIFTGNPVREEIRDVKPMPPPLQDKFVILCFGGSQGAKKINEAVFSCLRFLRNRRDGIRIIHQVGFGVDVEMVKDIYAKEGFEAEVSSFIDNMAEAYDAAHLVVCRAGATTIAELTATARPAILVPYPFAANDHQTENAMCVAEKGGAIVVSNDELTGEKLSEIIAGFMNNPKNLLLMAEAMKKMAKPYAARTIAEECLKLCT